MADNTTLNTGTGGDVIAADDVGGIKHQRVKIGHGVDGAATDVHAHDGFPIVPSEAAADAFGRLRVSNPTAVFSSQLEYDGHRILWESNLAGSATDTHSADGASATLAVTASASDTGIRQTRRYHRYQPGKGQLMMLTGTLGTATAGIDKRMGYFDANNGVFLEQNSTTALNVVLRSNVSGSVVNTTVAQASWNIDPFDGTGISGVTLDVTKAQLFVIDLEWLSVGRVRLGFIVTGTIHYAHEFLNANVTTGAYMTTANLPVRYEIDNTTGANAGSIVCLCATVISEGGFNAGLGLQFCATNGASLKTIGTTENACISIRPKATFNSIVNRGLIMPTTVRGFTENKAGLFQLWYGVTLGGTPSWTSANADSIVEFDVAGTTLTGGVLLDATMVEKAGRLELPSDILLPLTLDLAGAHPTSPYSDVLTVAFTARSTTSGVTASIAWHEVR